MDGMRGSLRQWRQKNFSWDWCSGVIIYDFLFWVRKSLINSSRWSSVMRLGLHFVVACFYKSFSIKVFTVSMLEKTLHDFHFSSGHQDELFRILFLLWKFSDSLSVLCVGRLSHHTCCYGSEFVPTVCPLTPTLSCDVYYKPQPATLVNSWRVTRYI